MDDLVTWLGEQIDEDRRVALSVDEDDLVWEWSENAENVRSAGGSYVACGPWDGDVYAEFAQHISRWDPTRVLAEVAAKRAILDEYAPALKYWNETGGWDGSEDALKMLVGVLRALALPYRDRPGWKPEWEPRPGFGG
jgi:hypothetical protein